MGKPKSFWILLSLSAILALTPLRADQLPAVTPTSVFQSHNLTTFGFWLILPNESSVHDGVWALKQTDESLRTEAAGRRNLHYELDTGRKLLDSLEDEFLALNDQVTRSVDAGKSIDKKDVQRYNDWINQNNELLGQREAIAIKIDKERRALEDLKDREATVEDSRARYISLVMDIGTKAESVAAAYDQLAKDPELNAAIAQANRTASPPLRLGPTSAFLDDYKFIRQCVKDVVSGTVPVQKTRSGGLLVEAVLNGSYTAHMVWDSGADTVTLSAATGRALRLVPDKYETIHVTVADGRTVEAKAVTLDSIRLGAFTLHDVDCILMPDLPKTHVMDLLGDTFQSHFLSRLNQRTGQLQLTPIDSSITQGPVPGPLPKIDPNPNADNPDVARRATATASSAADGFDPAGAIDGIMNGSPKNEWASADRTGSITLTWPDQLIISSVKLWERHNPPGETNHITGGQLVFDDGTSQPFTELPQGGAPLIIRFRPKYIRWMRVEIQTVTDDTQHPGFAEIAAYR